MVAKERTTDIDDQTDIREAADRRRVRVIFTVSAVIGSVVLSFFGPIILNFLYCNRLISSGVTWKFIVCTAMVTGAASVILSLYLAVRLVKQWAKVVSVVWLAVYLPFLFLYLVYWSLTYMESGGP